MKDPFKIRGIWFILMFSLTIAFGYQFYDTSIHSVPIYSAFAKGIFCFSVMLLVYTLGKFYCSEWYKIVKRNTIMLFLVERIVIPSYAVYSLFGLGYTSLKADVYGYIVAVIAISLFFFADGPFQ